MSQRKSILEEDVTASPRRSTRTSRSMCDSPVPLLAKLKENFKQKIALQNDDNSSNEDSSKSSNTPVRRSTRLTSRESSVEPESTEVIPQRRVTRSMSKSPTSLTKTTGTPKRISKRKSSISDKAEVKVMLQQLDIITEIETEDKNTMKQNDQETPKRSEDVETNENKSTEERNTLEDDGGSSETKETEIEKNNTYDSVSKTTHNTSDELKEISDKKENDQLKEDAGSIQEKTDKILELNVKQKENLIESPGEEIETDNLHKIDPNVANTSEEENKSSSETDKPEVVTESTEVVHNNSTQDINIEANRSHSLVLEDKTIESQDSKESDKNKQLVASMKSVENEIVEKETTDSDKNKSVVKSTSDLNLSKVCESTEKTSLEKGMEVEVDTSEELFRLKLDVSDEKTTSATVEDLKDDKDENTSNILIVGNTASSPQSSNDDCIPKECNFNLDNNSDSNKNAEEENLNLSLVNDDGHSYSPICKLKDVPVYTENTGTLISKINDQSSNSTPIKLLEKIKTPKKADFSPIVKKSDENKTPRVTPKSKTKITKSPIVEESFEEIQPKKSGSKKRRLNSDSESDIELENNLTKKNRSVEADKLSEENMSEHEISSSDSMDEGDGNKNKFIDDMAVEVSGEDTPSDGSNDIIEVGESIGSTESEIDSDESYERDSFVVEDDEASDRLLSSDDEVEKSIQASSWPHKSKRIITVSSSEDEETDNLSTQPFGGKSPSIVSVNQISSTNSDIESVKNRNEELSQMIEGVLEVKPSVPQETEESTDSKPVKEEKEASSNDLQNENYLTKEVKAFKKPRLSEKSFIDIQETVSKYIAKETSAKDKVMESKHDQSKNDNSSPGKLTESAKKRKKGKNENNLEDSKLLEDFHDITNKEAEISIGNVEEMEKLELSLNMSTTKDKQKQNKKEVKDDFNKTVECSTPKVVTSEKKTKLSNSGKKRNKNKIKNKDCLDETNVLKDFFDIADLTGIDLENRNEQDVNITLTSLKDDSTVHQTNESFKNKAKKRKSLENEQCDVVETVKQSSPKSEQPLSDSGRKKRRQNKNKSQRSLDESVVLQDKSNEDECKNYVSLPVTEKVHAEITPKKQSSPISEQPLSKSSKKKMRRNRNKSQSSLDGSVVLQDVTNKDECKNYVSLPVTEKGHTEITPKKQLSPTSDQQLSESGKKKRKRNKNKSLSSLDDSVVLQDVIDEVEPKNYVKMPVTKEVNTEITSKKARKSSRKKRSLNKNTSDALNDSNTLKDFFKMATKENTQNQEKSPQKHDSTPADNNNKKKRKSLKSDSSSYDESAVGMYVLNTVSQPCNSDKNVTSEENTPAGVNQKIQKHHRTQKMKKISIPRNTEEILESSQTNEKSKTKTKENRRIRPRKRGSETSVEEINKQEKIIMSKKLKIESNKQQVQTESTSNLSETGHSAEKRKRKRRRLRNRNKKQSESETYTSNENLSKNGQISKENAVKNVSIEKSASSNVNDDILTTLNKKKHKQLKKPKTNDKEATNITPDNDQVPTKKHKKEIILSLSEKQKNVALNKTEKENVDVPRTQMNFIVMKNKNTRASLSKLNNRKNTNSIPKLKNLIKPSSIGMTSGNFSVTNVEIPVVSNKLNKIKKRKTVPNTSSLSLHRKAGHMNLLQECLQGPSVKRISSKEFSKLNSK